MTPVPDPSIPPLASGQVAQTLAGQIIGTVGSPSTTSEVTVDILEDATATMLLGDLVALTHQLEPQRHLLAVGTVAEIETRNRWHEDLNMRGVVKMHGRLPHLSTVGDTRTAKVVIQAVYETDSPHPPFQTPPHESSGALGMSPSTGMPVRRVDDETVGALISRHESEVVNLGHIYRSHVKLPMYVRDFSGEQTDGAFHVGVFGRNGSGKTALAVYWLAAQMRHLSLGVLAFDPQGQFSSQNGFPFDLKSWARSLGREVLGLSIAEDVRLPAWATTFVELLDGARFFHQLTIKQSANRETALDEFVRLLHNEAGWDDRQPDEVLRALLTALQGDVPALTRIYNSKGPRDRIVGTLDRILTSASEFEQIARIFRPVHNLFAPNNLAGRSRTNLLRLIHKVVDGRSGGHAAPYVIIDLSARSGLTWLDDPETKARLIKDIASNLRRVAEERWHATERPINCCVVFDEAHRFASSQPAGEQTAQLAASLTEYVRTTRKYGLGWMFITQEVSALSPGIYTQLRVKAFGYGLTTGSDLNRLTDEVGRGPALELYKSFSDPRAVTRKTYPFMLIGPVSPLSFTSAPIFLEVHTDVADFLNANQHLFATLPVPTLPQQRQ
ncbi:ATP-binding protein [Kitasatospora sp. NPDC090308]|uniref:ATP-binding protein n=1 Tax=Kitasatospora sp. NPDC090308 TaxID=3364082 RepID=UPI00381185FE